MIEVGGSQNLARISITGRGYKKALLGPVYSCDSVGLTEVVAHSIPNKGTLMLHSGLHFGNY